LAPDLMHSGAQSLVVGVWLSVAVLPPHQSQPPPWPAPG
jgi:hypothetical protein